MKPRIASFPRYVTTCHSTAAFISSHGTPTNISEEVASALTPAYPNPSPIHVCRLRLGPFVLCYLIYIYFILIKDSAFSLD